MAALGIITCEVLELEFAYLLTKDKDIETVTVLEDDFSSALAETLESGDVHPVRIANIRSFKPSKPNRLEALVRVLELGLHNRKKSLQEGLVEAAKNMGDHVDAIILGYGLCGNALENPEELLADAGVPIFVPMDDGHPIDDCVGLIIGGRDNYYQEQCRVAGTFFMTPGWTRHWRGMFEKTFGGFNLEESKRTFGMSNYERSLLVPNSVLSEKEMQENINEFNEIFGFRTEVRQGTLEILRKTWESAKNSLSNP